MAVQYDCISLLEGGSSQVFLKLLEEVLGDQYVQGFSLPTPEGHMTFKQEPVCFFLGDNEAIRAVTLSKGSSGLKPCLHCSNLLKKGSNLRSAGDVFVELDAHTGFVEFTNQEVFDIMDNLASCVSRTQQKHLEKVSGFCWSSHGVWSSSFRERCPPDHMLTDLMHSYYVNGVASWEIAMFMEKILEHTNMSLTLLRQAILSSGWTGFPRAERGSGYLQALFHERLFGDGLYKGQCHQTRSVLPLLRFYCETMVVPTGRVPDKFWKSFLALCDVVECIDHIKHIATHPGGQAAELDRLQQRHHILYGEAYGAGAFKPKHHHRLHLTDDLRRLGMMMSTECLEAKHQLYKGGIGQFQMGLVRANSAFSGSVLCRLLQGNHASLMNSGLPCFTLAPPIATAPLEEQVDFATTFLKESDGVWTA